MRLADITVIALAQSATRPIEPLLASLHPDVALVVVSAGEGEPVDLQAAQRDRGTVIRSAASPGAARQLGAQSAATPWFLFTDTSVSFAPDYWLTLSDLVVRPWGAVYGPKLGPGHRGHSRRFARGRSLLDRLGIPVADGSNLLISRRALVAAGGFDISLHCNEDAEVCWRIQRAGYRVRYEPRLVTLAQAHRECAQGATSRGLRSLARCALLYADLLPERWRSQPCDGAPQSSAPSHPPA